jgi:hypothetical protein
MMPYVTGKRLLFTMAEAPPLGYYEHGDNSKTPPNAPHCLLLWRKPPPGKSPGGGIALIEFFGISQFAGVIFFPQGSSGC